MDTDIDRHVSQIQTQTHTKSHTRTPRTTMAEVKVHGAWFSPFSKRVEMALKLKGVDYEYIEEDLPNKSSRLLEYNPVYKKIPVLVHNGSPIAESSIILEYVDDVWASPSLLPEDPYRRAQARFWAKFIAGECMEAMWKALWSKGEEREKGKVEATEALKFLEDEIKGKKYFGGDNIGLVDITANFLAHWYPIMQELVGLQLWTQKTFPNLSKWADRYRDDSFLKKYLPDKDRLFVIYKKYMETGSPY